jgi:hypothetical protein
LFGVAWWEVVEGGDVLDGGGGLRLAYSLGMRNLCFLIVTLYLSIN